MQYFVDTNIIIDFLNKEFHATKLLTDIAKQDASELFINRLVYLESLRTIPIEHSRIFQEAKETLEMFEFVDINQQIYDDAIAFSRYCRQQGVTIKGKCAAIDFLHFCTAKYYQLELLAYDKDMAKLAEVYNKWFNHL